MAAIVSVKDLEMIEGPKIREKKKGLLAAISAWEDLDDLEEMVMTIYERRGKAKRAGCRETSLMYLFDTDAISQVIKRSPSIPFIRRLASIDIEKCLVRAKALSYMS